jgi:hypothetical protein
MIELRKKFLDISVSSSQSVPAATQSVPAATQSVPAVAQPVPAATQPGAVQPQAQPTNIMDINSILNR